MSGFNFPVHVELDTWPIEQLEELQEAVRDAIRKKTGGKRALKLKTEWTSMALGKVLSHLRGTWQATVIEAAAERGGRIARAEVMAIIGRDENKTLTGFTKPIGRSVQELLAAGEEGIPASEPFPFVPVYDGSSKAQGFRIKPAALTRMRAAIEGLR